MGKIYVNENKILLSHMIQIYKPLNLDWMSYQITKNNGLTIHHIIEISNGGLTTLDNSALITKRAHRVLNILQEKDFLLYTDWNDLFTQINQSKKPLDNYFQNESKELKKHTQRVLYKHL